MVLIFNFFIFQMAFGFINIQSLENQKTYINGPNCWNSVLFIHGFVSHIRYSSPEEIKFWLNSPYCTQFSADQIHVLGDIISIKQNDEEIHSMIWLDKENVFSKNTSHRLDAYSTISRNLVDSMFRAQDRDVIYYRCHFNSKDLIDYLNSNQDFKIKWQKVQKIGYSIHKIAFDSSISITETKKLAHVLKSDLNKIESEIKEPEDFFEKSLLQEINSLKTQFKLLM